MVVGFNLSATLNVARLVKDPKLCLPSIRYSNFNQISFPLPDHIKGIVLDKDNCFAKPDDDKVWHEYEAQWNRMRQLYPGKQLLIVSNSAGTDDDHGHVQADLVERNTGVPVLHHSTKKPGCQDEIMAYFQRHQVCQHPSQVAVIGDRLFTDIAMANTMGAYSVWLSEGVLKSTSPLVLLEQYVYRYLARK